MQFYTLSQQSLAHSGSSVVEEYIPIWFSDGTYATIPSSTSYTSAGQRFLQDGSSSDTGTASTLFTLNAGWPKSQLFAFEVTGYQSPSGSNAGYVALWDITSSSLVTASQITLPATNATVVRSPQFTLIPGHTYGVTIWSNTTNTSGTISDASLVVFGQ